MEKFGLRADRSARNTALELEIVKEQASALGIAGRALRLSLERYQKSFASSHQNDDSETLMQDIADKLWALVLQREFLGFIDGNIDWVKANYHIPEAAFRKMGSKRG